MKSLYEKLRDERFEMLAVSIDSSDANDEVEAFVREFDLPFPILRDPSQEVYSRYGSTGVPETYLVDADGLLAEHFIGPRDWQDPKFEASIRRLLRQGEPAMGKRDG